MAVTSQSGETREAIPCRLCGAESKLYGRKLVRGQYDVAYFQCTACGSLQTEEPYWLDEAYRIEGLGLDVGAGQRCLNLSLEVTACLVVLGIGGSEPCLDYGSGLGLFSRMMRDRGFDFRAYDKFIKPFFMDRFTAELGDTSWRALTVFEVFEHMTDPAGNCAEIFSTKADAIFFTTQTWAGQGLDWWYIVPLGGQHVFFYTQAALRELGRKHGYTYLELRGVKLFLADRIAKQARKLSPVEKLSNALKKSAWRKGRELPQEAAVRLHLLQDRRFMRSLDENLFARHQRDSFHWIERDFKALTSETKLP